MRAAAPATRSTARQHVAPRIRSLAVLARGATVAPVPARTQPAPFFLQRSPSRLSLPVTVAPRASYAKASPMSTEGNSQFGRQRAPTFTKDEMAEKFQRIARDIGVGFRDGKPVSLLEQFKKEQLAYTTRIVNGVLAVWSRSKLNSRLDNCEKTVKLMKADGVRPDAWTYEKLISTAHSMQNINKVQEYLAQMKVEGVRVDAVLYNHAIAILSMSGKEKEAYQMYQEMLAEGQVPVAATFGLLMSTFRKNDAMLEGLWADMQRLGVRPDSASFNLALQHEGSKPGGFARAKELFDDYLVDSNPDLRVFTTMLNIATSHRQSRVARNLLSDMRARGMRLDVGAVNAVLNLLAVDGDAAAAEKIMEDMKRNQLEPNIVTLRTMMKAYAVAGLSEKALAFLAELRKTEDGMKLIVEDYSIMHLLLKCFNKAKDLDRALQLYETFKAIGREPDHGVWRYLVEIPLRCNKPDVALQMYQRMRDAKFELEDPLLSEVRDLERTQEQAMQALKRVTENKEQ